MKRFASERVTGLMERLGLDDDVAIESRLVSQDHRIGAEPRRGLQLRHPQARRRVRRRHQQAARDDLRRARQGPPQRGPDRDRPDRSSTTRSSRWREPSRRRGPERVEPRRPVGRARGDGPDRRRHDARTTCWELRSREAIIEHVRDLADEKLAAKAAEVGEEDWKTVERLVLIRTIDSLWVEHLTELDDMRRGIGLRGYAQQDPLNEFKREAFQLYDELRGLIRHGVASLDLPRDRTRQPAVPAGGDPAVAASLARGAAALAGGNGSNGSRTGAGRASARGRSSDTRRPRRGRCGDLDRRRQVARRSSAAVRRRRPRARCANRSATSRSSALVPARRRAAPSRASLRAGRGSGATTRAGAGRARSTRSATVADIATLAARRRHGETAIGRTRPRTTGRSSVSWASCSSARTRLTASGPRVSVDEQRPADAIVVMGAAQYDGRPSPIFAARLDHAVALYLAGVAPALVVTGGKADGDRTTEAASRPGVRDRPGSARPTPSSSRTRAGRPSESIRSVSSLLRDNGLSRRGLRLGPAAHAPGAADGPRRRASRRGARRPRPARSRTTPVGRLDATIHELGALVAYFLSPEPAVDRSLRRSSPGTNRFSLLAAGVWPRILCQNPSTYRASPGPATPARPVPVRPAQHREREPVKQAEEASFVDLIACERDCRICSYAAALDCDGNCGVCPHNSYCPCVNPVVARSKTALRLIELRPILLQDLQARN